MPLISLSTNVKLDSEDAKKAFVTEFSKFCAKTVGKDVKFFDVDVNFNPYLTFGGTFEPAFMLQILCLEKVNASSSKVWSKEFSTFFEAKLGVPNNRGLMAFRDPGPDFVGFMGTSFQALRDAGLI